MSKGDWFFISQQKARREIDRYLDIRGVSKMDPNKAQEFRETYLVVSQKEIALKEKDLGRKLTDLELKQLKDDVYCGLADSYIDSYDR
jgi:hypothetical protein